MSHEAGCRGVILASAAKGLCEQIERNGGDPEVVLAQAGVAPGMLDDTGTVIDLATYVRLIEAAAAQTRQDNFGLHYGQAFGPAQLGPMGAIALASPNLGTALGNMTRLFSYHQQMTETSLRRSGGMLRLEYRILNGHIVQRRQDCELKLSRFANIFRNCLGARWAPEEVHCEHPRPDGWREHERIFMAPVYFSQPTNAIIFKQDDIHCRMPGANSLGLHALIEGLTSHDRPAGVLSISARVRSEIRSGLPASAANLDEIAGKLCLPRWRLQRELDRTGSNFVALVDDVRRQLSLQYLRNRHLPLGEIAALLGYSEPSAFSRSFSRWFGVSPRHWRTERLHSDA